jgi:hypothetical protein
MLLYAEHMGQATQRDGKNVNKLFSHAWALLINRIIAASAIFQTVVRHW